MNLNASYGALAVLLGLPSLLTAGTPAVTLTTSANPSVYGSPLNLVATVTAPGAAGSVTFYDSTTMLGIETLVNGQAILNTSLLPTGTRSLKAFYQGAAATLTQVVAAGPANWFQPPINYAVGNQPVSIAVADFNGDGRADLVVANSSSGGVSVLLGNGDGSFQPVLNYSTGGMPTAVAVGDFDGDGRTDIVTANQNSTISVLLGNGDGTFRSSLIRSVSYDPTYVVVGDFNGDGLADLAAADAFAGSMGILLGNGDGTFQPPVNYPVGGSPISVVVGDFNGDGHVDLIAVTNITSNAITSNLHILLGNGDGSFQAAMNFASGSSSYSVASEDLNGDGRADLIVTNDGNSSVSVLLGNGDGTFQPGVPYGTGASPEAVVVADFNGDGTPDLAVANFDGTLSLLLGNGDGTFQPAAKYGSGLGAKALVVAEFNGDGKADLAIADSSAGAISVLLGRSAVSTQVTLTSSNNPSSYGQSVTLAASVSPPSATGKVAFYDGVNLLGSSPVIAGQAALTTSLLASGVHALRVYYSGDALDTDSTSVILAQTVGTPPVPSNAFQSAATYSAGLAPQSIAVADFNGDGKADFAVASYGGVVGGGSIGVFLGNGDGTFKPPVNYAAGSGPISIAAGDFNADGNTDLVIANNAGNNISILLGNGNGTFQSPVNFAAGSGPVSVAIGDFNGDGKLDLVVANYGTGLTGSVSVLLGNGDGTFQAPLNYAVGFAIRCVVVGDFNGDGSADVAVGGGSGVSFLYGNGDGTFLAPSTIGEGNIYSIAAGDFNGDGVVDLAATVYNGSYIVVLLGNGGGTYRLVTNYAVGVNPRSIVVADVNGDGYPDLAVANFGLLTGGSGGLSVLLGNGDGTFQTAVSFPSNTNPTAVTAADFNGDGRTDLLLSSERNSVSLFLSTLGPPAFIVLESSLNPASIGQSVILAATVTPPAAGIVTFYDGKTVLGTNAVAGGQATLTTSFAAAGAHNLQARFTGTSSFLPAISPILTENVGTLFAPVVITLASSLNPSNYGQNVTLTATLVPAGPGTIAFYDGISLLGTSPLVNGQATLATSLLSSGTHSIKAYLLGDALVANNILALSQTIRPIPSTGFAPATTIPAGKNPFSIAAGDFNGDGMQDLAIANSGDGTVSILLGNGDGAFKPAVNYRVGSYPYSVAVGDFNLDGKPDLVVADNADGVVSVLLGNGDGTFRSAVSYPAGSGPYSVAVGDFNSDGQPDLAIVNQLSDTVSVLLGNGDGTFQVASNYNTGIYPNSIAVADLNADGKPDLIVANDFGSSIFLPPTVSVFAGAGNGSFFQSAATALGSGSGPTSVAIGDFNGDGKPDVAASDYTGSVRVLLGNGGFGFGLAIRYAAGINPWFVTVADVNGDGKQDVVVVNEGDNSVGVLAGKGDGTFQAAIDYPVGNSPVSVVAGDFNGDGKTDLAVVNYGDGSVSVLLGK